MNTRLYKGFGNSKKKKEKKRLEPKLKKKKAEYNNMIFHKRKAGGIKMPEHLPRSGHSEMLPCKSCGRKMIFKEEGIFCAGCGARGDKHLRGCGNKAFVHREIYWCPGCETKIIFEKPASGRIKQFA